MLLISPETFWPDEKETLLRLFDAGLPIYHLRKPNLSTDEVRAFMNDFPAEFHARFVLHYHFELAEAFDWRGFHFNKRNVEERKKLAHIEKPFSYSAHTFQEVESLKSEMEYQFLSPIFDSISKAGYQANFDFAELSAFLQKANTKVVALGGISPENYVHIKELGFYDAAVLGFIWNRNLSVEERTQRLESFSLAQPFEGFKPSKGSVTERPFVLTIGGFDPSGGAGVLADIKTFEANEVQGLAVITSNTIQTDNEFRTQYPISEEEIIEQLDLILKRFEPKVVKIGLVPSFGLLHAVLKKLSGKTIIWDSVLKASAGFSFHENTNEREVIDILKKISLITPNWPEARKLFLLDGLSEAEVSGKLNRIAQETQCAILLKGGHTGGSEANDTLFSASETIVLKGKRLEGYEKHGTGCMLSSAIAAEIAKGEALPSACTLAKQFVAERMQSNRCLLAYF